MKTAEEIASMFFADTGEKKSTNWTRLRDLVGLRDREVIERCAQEAENGCASMTGGHECKSTRLAARIRALAAPPAGVGAEAQPGSLCQGKCEATGCGRRWCTLPPHQRSQYHLCAVHAPAGTGGRR